MEKILDLVLIVLYIIVVFDIIRLLYDIYKRETNEISKVPIVTVRGAEVPQKATSGASGYDFKAHFFKKIYRENGEEILLDNSNTSSIYLHPKERVLISTGVRMKIPKGFELQIRSRSGLTLKQGLIVLNSPGTIDSDYLGDIGVILYNAGNMMQKICIGDRICQGVFTKVEEVKFKESTTLEKTKRGNHGFGSTGRN